MEEASAKVTSIFVYPIKSCHGISVSQAPISSTGFRWDRQWLIVNENGRLYTQRNQPKLALVQVELPTQAFSEGWKPSTQSYMLVKAPGMETLKVSLTKPRIVVDHVSIWNWSGSALDEGDEAAKWFSTYIGKTSRLVRFDPELQTRSTDPDYARGYQIMFADIFPFLMISQESLDTLNKISKEQIPIERFRPNILVEGCAPFSEDLWKEIRINRSTFNCVKLCERCKVTTINQKTAIAGSEPIETMRVFRSDKVLFPDKKPQRKTYMGQLLVCTDCAGGRGKIVQVGDTVTVLKQVSCYADAAA